jgi:membrane associated rhomboid family serine protease
MSYSTLDHLGPPRTPDTVRRLLLATCAITLFSALTNTLFRQVFGWPGLQDLLSLSWPGIHKYYFWQPVSYMFVLSDNSGGISLFFLLGLAFNMYLVWIIGSAVFERLGSSSFLRFYFFSGIFAAAAALTVMQLTGIHEQLSGQAPVILALLTIWTLMYPEMDILLFFILSLKAKWLLAVTLGTIILISVSQLDWIGLSFYLSGIAFGYLYALLNLNIQSPFSFTRRFDLFMMSLGSQLRQRRAQAGKLGQENGKKAKIFDIKTGELLLDDEQFVDAMLTKISKHGEPSLSFHEKRRLEGISKKKRQRQSKK